MTTLSNDGKDAFAKGVDEDTDFLIRSVEQPVPQFVDFDFSGLDDFFGVDILPVDEVQR